MSERPAGSEIGRSHGGRGRRLRRAVATAGLLVALAAVACVAVSYSPAEHSGRVPPRVQLLLFYIRVFRFHAGLVALVGATAALAMRVGWKRPAVAAICAIGLLLPFLRDYAPKRPPAVAGQTLRVLSMNLYAYNRAVPRILAAIDSADADVIVASEVTAFTRANVFATLRERYPYSAFAGRDAAFVMSRVRFTIGQPMTPDGQRPLVFDLDGEPLALYGVHLISPGGFSHLAQNREQARELADIARRELRPMVVVGDCNFSQTTAQYALLRDAGLRTTQDLVGFGINNTWGPRWWRELNRLPGVRIDQMFLSRELTAKWHKVGPDTGSDHRPIIAEIGRAARAPQ